MVTTASLHTLPPEAVTYIVTFLPQPTLKNLRLVDRRLSVFASQQAFRKIRLLARNKDDNNPRHFIQLANSNLSSFVREVTCDASGIVHNGVTYVEEPKTNFLPVFWDSLPSLACFRSLRSLHVLFDTRFATHEPDYEPTDFRRRVLAIVFRALARTGTEVLQKAARNVLSHDVTHLTAHEVTVTPPALSTPPIPLSTLIISNLEDCNDSRLTDIPEFTTIMSGVQALRLDITQRNKHVVPATSLTIAGVWNQCREMFTQLPHTWLSLPVAANLQVLSLYYDSWWGWLPNVDFRLIGGGEGMPKLRTLALGHFIFSHEWQVDWITSLSLKELYLDDCAVLAQYLDYPTTQEGYWTNGHESPNATDTAGEMKSNSLRWCSIFSQIRNSMPTLKVFRTLVKPNLIFLLIDYMGKILSDLSCRDPGLSTEEEVNRLIVELLKSLIEDGVLHFGQYRENVFRHFTFTTPCELSLESDVFTEAFIPDMFSFKVKYLAHHPIYWEEARYKNVDDQKGALKTAWGAEDTDVAELKLLYLTLRMRSSNNIMARNLSMGTGCREQPEKEDVAAVVL